MQISDLLIPVFTSPEFKTVLKEVLTEAMKEQRPSAVETADKKFYTREEAAKLLRVSLSTLDRFIHNGTLESKQAGVKYLITPEAIQKVLSTPRKWQRRA